jgi:hypothetical protein
VRLATQACGVGDFILGGSMEYHIFVMGTISRQREASYRDLVNR